MKPKNWRWWRRKAIKLQQWRACLQAKLLACGVDQPVNSTLLLLASALDRDKSWILAHSEYQPTPHQTSTIETLTSQVADGHPLPYVLGRWEFFGRSFKVSPDVLIPRPETEILVEFALDYAQQILHPRIADVGTGSGAIAVSLAAELPQAELTASDISWPALQIARENAWQHGLMKIHFVQAHLLAPLRGPWDLICANLPYIPSRKLGDLEVARWEPRLALDGGQSGLAVITALLAQARPRLAPEACILLEIEASQGTAAVSIAQDSFPTAQIELIQDLAGNDRVVAIRTA